MPFLMPTRPVRIREEMLGVGNLFSCWNSASVPLFLCYIATDPPIISHFYEIFALRIWHSDYLASFIYKLYVGVMERNLNTFSDFVCISKNAAVWWKA